jgi:hypothetical protein
MAEYGDGHLPHQRDALARQHNEWNIRLPKGSGFGQAFVCPFFVGIARDTGTKLILWLPLPDRGPALKERIYVLSGVTGGAPDRCGILIYTATAGAQGTLGGLVGTAPRFANILRSALERTTICSNDPVCADHEPDDRSGDRATHGAACHGCLLIAETSCEMRNLFLDRNLLVPTMATDGAAFFDVFARR